MEGAVRGDGRQHLADRLRRRARAPLAADSTTMRDRAHAEDHPVPATVERQRRVLDVLVGRGRAGREEAGAHPLQQRVGGDVVGGDDRPPGGNGRRGSSPRRSRRPAWSLAQAALTCVFGPRAPMISANCEWPIARTRNRNRRSNSNGSRSIVGAELPRSAVDLRARAGIGRSTSRRGPLEQVASCSRRLWSAQNRSSSVANASSPGTRRRTSRRCRRAERRGASTARAVACRCVVVL